MDRLSHCLLSYGSRRGGGRQGLYEREWLLAAREWPTMNIHFEAVSSKVIYVNTELYLFPDSLSYSPQTSTSIVGDITVIPFVDVTTIWNVRSIQPTTALGACRYWNNGLGQD